eukprot:UN00872
MTERQDLEGLSHKFQFRRSKETLHVIRRSTLEFLEHKLEDSRSNQRNEDTIWDTAFIMQIHKSPHNLSSAERTWTQRVVDDHVENLV